MTKDIEGSEYDIGTTSIRLIRAGNLVQILYSNPLEAEFGYRELAQKYKQLEDRLRGG